MAHFYFSSSTGQESAGSGINPTVSVDDHVLREETRDGGDDDTADDGLNDPEAEVLGTERYQEDVHDPDIL